MSSTTWCESLLMEVMRRFPVDTNLVAGSGGLFYNSSSVFDPPLRKLDTEEYLRHVGRNPTGGPVFLGAHAQDLFVWYNHARFLNRRGFYVDLATNDAIARSNTYFLDRCLGWSGLCIEPNPLHHARIRRERSCELLPNGSERP